MRKKSKIYFSTLSLYYKAFLWVIIDYLIIKYKVINNTEKVLHIYPQNKEFYTSLGRLFTSVNVEKSYYLI